METRKVIFVNSKTQSQRVIENSTATTLGELKQEMRAAGIDYDGMTFYEGHMRAELKDDASPLPTNIPYKGTTVNDLTFMLTTPEKKVRSGAMSRAEAYDKIRELGLQDECKKKFGRNFTQCSTDNLISLVASAEREIVKNTPKVVSETPAPVPVAEIPAMPEEVVMPNAETPNTCGCGCEGVKKALKTLTEALYSKNVIEHETYTGVKALLDGKEYVAPTKMSKSEIDEMFDFVK